MTTKYKRTRTELEDNTVMNVMIIDRLIFQYYVQDMNVNYFGAKNQ